ncbi:phosphotransferase enzyme family protein [Kribbella sp. CA-253562]|uniref:phosphotransferase enzyme family protein n=1 Tax=Kribbella sp. CA-253562 TaxID=3239942 RepID=UPI003D8A0F37
MLPMGLSMLWEKTEPEQALRERFGLTGFEAAGEWVGEVLGAVWGIEAAGCGRLVISDQNAIVWMDSDRGPLVVKWSRAQGQFDRLEASTGLLRVLDERGVPVAAPIPAPDGRVRVVVDGPACELSLAVLPEVTGDWLDVEDEDAVRAAGACLAELHNALTGYDDDRLIHNDTRPRPTGVPGVPPLDDAKQPVHNDFRAANILTRGPKIVAVLDFDELAWGHRVEDLAQAAIYLGTRFTNWQPTSPAVRRTFREGYETVRPLRPAEDRAFEPLLRWYEQHSGF